MINKESFSFVPARLWKGAGDYPAQGWNSALLSFRTRGKESVFLIPIILPFHTKLLRERKSQHAEILAAPSDTGKGCILQGNRSWKTKAKNWESTEVQYRTEKLALTKAEEKWGKVTTKERNRKAITIKWKSDLTQARSNQLKNYKILIWGGISS